MSALLTELHVTVGRVSKEGRAARLIGSRLIVGIQGEETQEQLKVARTALSDLEERLSKAEGDERLFYISRFTEWNYRLGVILRQQSRRVHHEEVEALIQELQLRIADLT
ncbi:hypothetical protein D3C77_472500 [compost metagenome]